MASSPPSFGPGRSRGVTAGPLARDLSELAGRPDVEAAIDVVRETDERTLREQLEIAEIPAPPFSEAERARRIEAGFREAGLLEVARDRAGNVLGVWPGRADLPPLIVSAHLDTVFPEGTDLRVRREGNRYVGPGITDDSRGLAVLLATARALSRAGVRPLHPILFVATVGEEGPGNLRGVKHLFGENGGGRRCHAFVSLDGAGLSSIVTRGVGSTRLRFHAAGPGGHSWADWGERNPLHALARGIVELLEYPLGTDPRTTLTVARWGGGRSINSIPDEGWVEVDLRSEDAGDLEELERGVRERMARAVGGERGDAAPLEIRVEEIGRRPSGGTDAASPLVRAAVEASRFIGVEPHLTSSSTDSNVPMSLGIPAVTMGAGGEGGRAHTPQEWYRNTRGEEGVVRALLTLLSVSGVEARAP